MALAGKRYRIAGANEYWLGLLSTGSPPSHRQISDGLQAAKTMGSNTIRSISLGTSVGCVNCIEPALGRWNPAAFDALDYAVATAQKLGIRLLLPLTDDYSYYYGGKSTFTKWLGLPSPDDFYSSPRAVDAYEAYIAVILNHIDRYTGQPLKDSSSILAWETGNEMATANGSWNNAWTETISTFIKRIDRRHLVADGHLMAGVDGAAAQRQLGLPQVDLYTDHMYPPNSKELIADARLATDAHKVYFVGEYDWRNISPRARASLLARSPPPTATNVVGVSTPSSVYWSAQVIKDGLTLPAETYRLAAHIVVSKPWPITIVAQLNHAPWTTASSVSLTVRPGTSDYRVSFTVPATLNGAMVTFNVGSTAGTISVGSFSLTPTGNHPRPALVPMGHWRFQLNTIGGNLAPFLQAISRSPDVSGDLFWQLYGYTDDHIPGGDEYALVLPGRGVSGPSRANGIRGGAPRGAVTTVEDHDRAMTKGG